jgi:hypothetical protein
MLEKVIKGPIYIILILSNFCIGLSTAKLKYAAVISGYSQPPPPPHTHFLKVKKCPFFWAKVPYLKNEKSIF